MEKNCAKCGTPVKIPINLDPTRKVYCKVCLVKLRSWLQDVDNHRQSLEWGMRESGKLPERVGNRRPNSEEYEEWMN